MKSNLVNTGTIHSGVNSEKYKDNFDKIFNKDTKVVLAPRDTGKAVSLHNLAKAIKDSNDKQCNRFPY